MADGTSQGLTPPVQFSRSIIDTQRQGDLKKPTKTQIIDCSDLKTKLSLKSNELKVNIINVKFI